MGAAGPAGDAVAAAARGRPAVPGRRPAAATRSRPFVGPRTLVFAVVGARAARRDVACGRARARAAPPWWPSPAAAQLAALAPGRGLPSAGSRRRMPGLAPRLGAACRARCCSCLGDARPGPDGHGRARGRGRRALARRRDALVAPDGPAEDVARRIGRTIPARLRVDGHRPPWPRGAGRPRSTRTPRRRPSAAVQPEPAHNELAGWGQTATSPARSSPWSCCATAARPRGARPVARPSRGDRRGGGRHHRGVGARVTTTWPPLRPGARRRLCPCTWPAEEGVDPGPVPAVDEAAGATRPVHGLPPVELSPAQASASAQLSRSTIMAMPWPPPTHIDSRPKVCAACPRAR